MRSYVFGRDAIDFSFKSMRSRFLANYAENPHYTQRNNAMDFCQNVRKFHKCEQINNIRENFTRF